LKEQLTAVQRLDFALRTLFRKKDARIKITVKWRTFTDCREEHHWVVFLKFNGRQAAKHDVSYRVTAYSYEG